jgi:hypothetical protein
MRARPVTVDDVARPPENGKHEVMAPMQWRDVTVGGHGTGRLSLVLPCTEEPELFFAESAQDVEQAKAMCRGCRARLACLAGALERRGDVRRPPAHVRLHRDPGSRRLRRVS